MFCCLGWQVDSSSRHAGDHHGRSPRHPIFKGRHFDEEIIILCLRWYVTYKLSFRDLAEMMLLRRRRARLAARSRAALSVASPHEVTDDLLHPAPMRALPVDRVAAVANPEAAIEGRASWRQPIADYFFRDRLELSVAA